MKGDYQRKSGWEVPLSLMMGLVVLCVLFNSVPAAANGLSLSGESNTIFRGSKTTDDRKLYPLYEYLRFSGENKAGDAGSVSFNVGRVGPLRSWGQEYR